MTAEPGAVEALVAFVHVADVRRATRFYEQLGFEVRDTHDAGGRRVWCWLQRGAARLMLAQAGQPVVAEQQAVLFYAYVDDLDALHARLAAAGYAPGDIGPGAPGPAREFRVCDPDGYTLMVADAGALAG